MFTDAEITAAQNRLQGNRLKMSDVDKWTQTFRMLFAGLETRYNYKFEEKVTALDDNDGRKRAATFAAGLNKLDELGFGNFALRGGRSGVEFNDRDDWRDTILFCFSLLYPVPSEFSAFDLRRANSAKAVVSTTTQTTPTWN